MTKRPRWRPSLKELEQELSRIRRGTVRRRWLGALSLILLLALLAGVYMAGERFALMSVRGDGMRDTLLTGDLVFLRRGEQVARGDVVAFEREGAILLRRVIALAGDKVSVSQEDGSVFINGVCIEESYLLSRGRGVGDTEYPLTVPEAQVFVMGDHRLTAADSRSRSVGTIALREIIGRAEARIWPVERIGSLH